MIQLVGALREREQLLQHNGGVNKGWTTSETYLGWCGKYDTAKEIKISSQYSYQIGGGRR